MKKEKLMTKIAISDITDRTAYCGFWSTVSTYVDILEDCRWWDDGFESFTALTLYLYHPRGIYQKKDRHRMLLFCTLTQSPSQRSFKMRAPTGSTRITAPQASMPKTSGSNNLDHPGTLCPLLCHLNLRLSNF